MSEKPQDEQLCPECAQPCTRDTQGDVQRHERGGGMGCAFGWENQPQAPARRHDGECSDEKRGLYGKYIIQRADGSDAPGGKHASCQYFVLDLTHDNYALPALREYARWCRGQFPLLADDLDALRTGTKTFDLTAQAPAPSLDALWEALRQLNEGRPNLARAVLEGALAASPSVTRDAINEAWIKGCLAGREEAADICDMMAAATPPHNETRRLQASNCAHEIRSLPSPTAPKEPQR